MNLRCFFGGHSITGKGLINSHGVIFMGEKCRDCGKFIKGPFLFNQWAGEERHPTHIELTGINPNLIELLKDGWFFEEL